MNQTLNNIGYKELINNRNSLINRNQSGMPPIKGNGTMYINERSQSEMKVKNNSSMNNSLMNPGSLGAKDVNIGSRFKNTNIPPLKVKFETFGNGFF